MPDPASVPDGLPTLDADVLFAIVPEWLLRSEVSDRAVRLYAVLGRYADKGTGVCYPSRATLAGWLHCSKESVDRAVKELGERGAVVATRRFDPEKRVYESTHYTVKRSSPVTTGSPSAAATPSRVGDEGVAAPVTTERESENESHLERENNAVSFDDAWKIYPRKTDKGGARKAWAKAVARVAPSVVLAGVERFAADPNLPDTQYVAHMSTWLNGSRWEDGPLPSRRDAALNNRTPYNTPDADRESASGRLRI